MPNPLLLDRSEENSTTAIPTAGLTKAADKKPSRKGQVPATEPVGDPFDPEIFNRTFASPE